MWTRALPTSYGCMSEKIEGRVTSFFSHTSTATKKQENGGGGQVRPACTFLQTNNNGTLLLPSKPWPPASAGVRPAGPLDICIFKLASQTTDATAGSLAPAVMMRLSCRAVVEGDGGWSLRGVNGNLLFLCVCVFLEATHVAAAAAALLSTPFLPCGLFVAARVHGTALIHIEGAFEESSSVQLFFFHPLRSPVLIYIQVSASVAPFLLQTPPTLRFCLFPTEKVLLHSAIHFHLYYTCLLRCTPPHTPNSSSSSSSHPTPPPRLFFLTSPSSASSFGVFVLQINTPCAHPSEPDPPDSFTGSAVAPGKFPPFYSFFV